MINKILGKFFALFLSFALIFNSVAPLSQLSYADDDSMPTSTASQEITPTQTQDPAPSIAPTDSPTPAPTDTVIPTPTDTLMPTPTEILTPTETPTPTQAPDVTPTPTLDLLPTLMPTITPIDLPQTTPTPTVTPEITPATITPDAPVPTETPTSTPEETQFTPAPTPVSVWMQNQDGSYTTTNNVEINKDYVSPFDNNLKINFSKLPDNRGTVTVKEISANFNLSQGQQVGKAYEVTSTMTDGTFLYDLTLPLPIDQNGNLGGTQTKAQNATVEYSEDGQTFKEAVNEKSVDTINHFIVLKNINHFTVYTISADTSSDAPIAEWTATAGPSVAESTTGQISTGTLILNVPSGFEFDTTADSVTATVTDAGAGCNASTRLQINGANTQITTPIADTITIDVTQSSSSSCRGTITWSGIQTRPVSGAGGGLPLPSGDLTLSGTASIGGATFSTNTFTEIAGAVSSALSYIDVDAIEMPADGASFATITVTLVDQFGNPVPEKDVTLASDRGALDTISASSGPSDTNGVVIFSVSSLTPGSPIFTATDSTDGITIDFTVSIIFTDPVITNRLVFTQQPSDTADVRAIFSLQPIVEIQDPSGTTIATAVDDIYLDTYTDPGCMNLTAEVNLVGTTILTTTSGVAAFTDLAYNSAETIYLGATSGSGTLDMACSNGITVNQIGTTTIASPINIIYGDGGAVDLTATLTDSSLTPISGEIIDFSVNGIFEGSAVTGADGVATLSVNLTGITAGTYVEGVSADFAGSAMYIASNGTADIAISERSLTVTGIIANDKVYDGTIDATLNTDNAILSDIVLGDTAILDTSGATGAFDDKNVGTGKTVTIAGLFINGADAGNYILTQPTATASITSANITVTAVTDTKAYDGNVDSTGTPTITDGALAIGDSATWTQTFDTKDAGTNKSLIPAGTVNDGNSGNNYSITFINDTTGVIMEDPTNSAFTAISETLTGLSIANNLNLVYSGNVNNFSGLYFEKIDENGDALGRLTFNNPLNLADSETTDFLKNLGNKLDVNQGRIALDARDSAIFAATGATLNAYFMPEVAESSIIVRDDLGNVLNAADIVSNFIYDPDTQTASFDAAHFTQFDFDTTTPTTIDDADELWHSNDQTITLICVDDLSGCLNTYYTTDGSNPTTSPTRQEGTSVVLSSDGVHTIKYYSVDAVGNTGDVITAINTVNIDKSAPTGLDSPTSGLTSPTNQSILGWNWIEATDLLSGVGSYLWSLFNGSTEVLSGTEASSTFSINTDISSLSDGIFTFKLKAEDNVGNFTDWISSSLLTVNRTLPTGSVAINSGNEYTNSRNVTLNFSGVSQDVEQIEIGNGAAGSYQASIGYENPHTYVLPNNGDGEYTVRVRFTDSAGNKNSAVISDTIILDTTAPTINFASKTEPNSNGWNNTDVTVNWNCTDLGSGAANSTVSQVLTGEGENQSATGTCIDNAGNTASNSQTGINIDSTAPSSPTANPAAGSYTDTQSVSLSSTGSSVTRYSTDGTPADCASGTAYSTPIFVEISTTLFVLACDNAGNSSSASFAYAIGSTDLEPPSDSQGESIVSSTIILNNGANLDLSTGVDDVSGGNITIDGVTQPLNNFTGGDLIGKDLSVPQTVGGQSITIGKAVELESTGDITLTNTDLANVSIVIPNETTVLAPSGWDGKISPPKTGSSSGSAPSGFSVGSTVIEVGSSLGVLLFDQPVIITLTGVTGDVGYKPAGSTTWTQITTTCGGTYANPAKPTPFGECAISNGTDTKIYTYHFTSFASLDTVSSGSNTSSSFSSGISDGKSDGLGCASRDCSGNSLFAFVQESYALGITTNDATGQPTEQAVPTSAPQTKEVKAVSDQTKKETTNPTTSSAKMIILGLIILFILGSIGFWISKARKHS